jgi:lipopolysaccharide heptosyltransferase II
VNGEGNPTVPLPATVYHSAFPLYLPAVLDAPNVLAVRFSSIGDVLLTTPLLRAIRHRHPESRISVLTKQAYAPLLSHNPHVSRVIGMSSGSSLPEIATELRSHRYTHLLDLHDSARTRVLRVLVPGRWRSYPKHRVARAALIYTKRNLYGDTRPVPERYFEAACDLAVVPDGHPPDLYLAAESVQEAGSWLARANLGRDRPLIAIAPGAAHATKRWPLQHWRTLVRQIVGAACDVAVVGGPDDVELGAVLAQENGGRVGNAAGRFNLQTTGAVLQRAATLVSGDTGVMHMATAVKTPVVALFGPTVRPFGFYPYTSRARVLELSLSCRPCSSKGGPRCPLGHHRCLGDLEPVTVFEAVRKSLP